MMFEGLKREIDQVAKDKGIDRMVIIGALEEALKQAARRKYGLERAIEAQFNDEAEEIELFEFKMVVDAITEPDTQITIEQAHGFVFTQPRPEPEQEVPDAVRGVARGVLERGELLNLVDHPQTVRRAGQDVGCVLHGAFGADGAAHLVNDEGGELDHPTIREFLPPDRGNPMP